MIWKNAVTGKRMNSNVRPFGEDWFEVVTSSVPASVMSAVVEVEQVQALTRERNELISCLRAVRWLMESAGLVEGEGVTMFVKPNLAKRIVELTGDETLRVVKVTRKRGLDAEEE